MSSHTKTNWELCNAFGMNVFGVILLSFIAFGMSFLLTEHAVCNSSASDILAGSNDKQFPGTFNG